MMLSGRGVTMDHQLCVDASTQCSVIKESGTGMVMFAQQITTQCVERMVKHTQMIAVRDVSTM